MLNMIMVSGWFLGNLIYRKGIKKQNWESSLIDATCITLITSGIYYIIH